MNEREKEEARTTANPERIFELVQRFGRGVQEEALKNPNTPAHVIEWIYKAGNFTTKDSLVARHRNTPEPILKSIIGTSIHLSLSESGDYYMPSWGAFNALISLLKRKGIDVEGKVEDTLDDTKTWIAMKQKENCDGVGLLISETKLMASIASSAGYSIPYASIMMKPSTGFTINSDGRVSTVCLKGKSMSELPKDIFQLEKLENLIIVESNLQVLPDEIGSLLKLKKLILDDNDLLEIPRSVGKLANLKELSVRGNKLTTIPIELRGLESLKVLSLSDNPLGSLPPVIQAWLGELKKNRCKVDIEK
nr:leucine-rich repeat domain-containing protein [Candidatus Sigynarchaeota archaeon]